jgi:hydrogenase-4 component B
MMLLAALCLLAGILPGLFIDVLAPVSSVLVGARMPVQSGMQWLSIIPIAASRSSYDGLLVFLFMVISGTLAAFVIHRFASNRLRRAPAWDCGYPASSPATQYTAMSFAQPIRRVFGSVVFQAREAAGMPPPGDTHPAWLKLELHDPVWDYLYAPLAAAVGRVADRLNRLQFLTIRQFLSLVFSALVILLLVLAVWSRSAISPFRARRCCWCCCSRRCSPDLCARPRRGCCGARDRRSFSLTAISSG